MADFTERAPDSPRLPTSRSSDRPGVARYPFTADPGRTGPVTLLPGRSRRPCVAAGDRVVRLGRRTAGASRRRRSPAAAGPFRRGGRRPGPADRPGSRPSTARPAGRSRSAPKPVSPAPVGGEEPAPSASTRWRRLSRPAVRALCSSWVTSTCRLSSPLQNNTVLASAGSIGSSGGGINGSSASSRVSTACTRVRLSPARISPACVPNSSRSSASRAWKNRFKARGSGQRRRLIGNSFRGANCFGALRRTFSR
jgi:hypothetical protein